MISDLPTSYGPLKHINTTIFASLQQGEFSLELLLQMWYKLGMTGQTFETFHKKGRCMSNEWTILTMTAASIGFFHTLFGPDHYLPFIVMARARRWSLLKTCWITILCGVGHVGSSVLLGIIGVILGSAVSQLEMVESFRGDLAVWALIVFGLVCFVWGLRRAWCMKPHRHPHEHTNGTSHAHVHSHISEHLHISMTQKATLI